VERHPTIATIGRLVKAFIVRVPCTMYPTRRRSSYPPLRVDARSFDAERNPRLITRCHRHGHRSAVAADFPTSAPTWTSSREAAARNRLTDPITASPGAML
jgi:hypothetical protein